MAPVSWVTRASKVPRISWTTDVAVIAEMFVNYLRIMQFPDVVARQTMHTTRRTDLPNCPAGEVVNETTPNKACRSAINPI